VAIPPLLNRILFRVWRSSCGGSHLDAAVIALAPASLVFPPITSHRSSITSEPFPPRHFATRNYHRSRRFKYQELALVEEIRIRGRQIYDENESD
jgi:hypothetical protein